VESQTKQHYRANRRRLETHSRLQLSKVTRSTRGSADRSLAFAFIAKNTEGTVHFCAAPSGNFATEMLTSRQEAGRSKPEIARDNVTGGQPAHVGRFRL